MFKNEKFELDFAGRKLTVEVGKLAKHTNASCLVQYGDTIVLATAVMGKEPIMGTDFFPLNIEVREKMYAAGKIKGSRFVKREGRPSDNATLNARMADRGIRPLFNQELRNEVQVVLTPLSYDGKNQYDVLSVLAAGIALHISDIPWNGPLAGICIGRIDGQLVVNPTVEQLKKSDMNLAFSIKGDKILMVDADAKEVTEEDMQTAFEFSVEEAKPLLDFIELIRQKVGLEKQDEKTLIKASQAGGEISLDEKKSVFEEAKQFFAPQLDKYLFNQPVGTKRERKEVAKKLLKEFVEKLEKDKKHEEIINYIKENFELYLESEVTKAILERDQRIDGRKLNEIRPLESEIDLLPRAHGSGLFSRGETQVMSVVTLGPPGDVQLLDEMTEDDTKKRYMHFYNSPHYAFGEPGFFRGAGRREIGHGALAEKALIPVLPSKEDFPHTILVVSEVMGSNGSSSMASTCGSTLSLMAAGVPIKKPVVGIAMGLASGDDQYKILTDLQDFEDGEGGMDFKITGTEDGITAIQMDTKTQGLSLEICQKTMTQAKEAQIQILDHIKSVINEPRKELSQYAPKIESMQIDPDKIKDVIGAGGKIINEIIDVCGVDIDIEDNGTVAVTGVDQEGMKRALKWINDLTREIKVGEIYDGKVVRLMDFGAFVEILPGRDGMVHISELSSGRVDRVEDFVKIDDRVKVKVIEIDDQNRVNLSIKKADPKYNPEDDYRNGDDRRPRFDNRRPRFNDRGRGGSRRNSGLGGRR